MRNRVNLLLAAAIVALSSAGASATGNNVQHGAAANGAIASTSAAMTAGEIRKVDTEQGKVTIKHEAIANLDMPAMTMVFRAQSPDMLKGLKISDKVRFHAESIGGGIVVTHIEPDS